MNYFALTALINLIAAIAGILLVAVRNRHQQEENKFFIGFCLAVIIWSFGYLNWQMANEYSSALFWIRILTIGSTLIPILYLRWIFGFITERSGREPKILKLGYLFTFIFLLVSFSPLFIKEVKPVYQFAFWPQPGYLYHFYILFSYAGLIGYGLIKLVKEYKGSKEYPMILAKTKLIILGTIIGFGGGAANFFLFYNIPIAPYANILASAGILLMTLAVRGYDIFYIPEKTGFDKVREVYYQRPEENEEELIVGIYPKIRQKLKSLHFSPVNKDEIKM